MIVTLSPRANPERHLNLCFLSAVITLLILWGLS